MKPGEKLRQLRKRLGWTQEEAAADLGLHLSHYKNMETGQRSVRLVYYRALERALSDRGASSGKEHQQDEKPAARRSRKSRSSQRAGGATS